MREKVMNLKNKVSEDADSDGGNSFLRVFQCNCPVYSPLRKDQEDEEEEDDEEEVASW